LNVASSTGDPEPGTISLLGSGLGMLFFVVRRRRRTTSGLKGVLVPTEGWLYRLLVALSGITLVLVVVYIVLIQDNRSVQREINQRQQFINQSIQLGRINDALIRALATTAVSNQDDKLRDLLTQNGITINPTTGAPEREAAPAAAAPVATGR
jgi:hypothetical protein